MNTMLKTYRDRDTGKIVKAEQFDKSFEMSDKYNIQEESRFGTTFKYIVYCWQRHYIQTGDWIITDQMGKVIDTINDHELKEYYTKVND